MLAIQEFLRSHNPKSALRHAAEEWHIQAAEEGDLALLNYNQFDSPKGVQEVEECRGLILRKPSWDVVAMPFYRFYNAGESQAAHINIPTATLQEKLDGSLVTLYRHNGQWHVSTRGTVSASGNVGELAKTFRQLFTEAVQCSMHSKYHDWQRAPFEEGLSYTFELCSPENRVVTPYDNKSLTLLMARKLSDLTELSPEHLDSISHEMGVKRPQNTLFSGWDHIKNLLSEMSASLEEGFVLVDYANTVNGNYPRVKVKNRGWLTAQRIIGGGFTHVKCLEKFLEGERDEILAYFPEYQAMFLEVETKLVKMAQVLDSYFAEISPLSSDRRAFAAKAKESPHPGVMFALLDGKFKNAYEKLSSPRRIPETGELSGTDLQNLWNLIKEIEL